VAVGAVAGIAVYLACFQFTDVVVLDRLLSGYYFVALATAGFLCGLVSGKRFGFCPVGIFFGQALCALPRVYTDPDFPLFFDLFGPLLIVIAFYFALICFVFALPGAAGGRLFVWLFVAICQAAREFRKAPPSDVTSPPVSVTEGS